MRELARRSVPRSVFDYVDGAADDELTSTANREAWQRLTFVPRTLRPAGAATAATTILGRSAELPLVLAPTGYSRLMNASGELAVAAAAARAGIPYALSTVGTTGFADVAAAAGHGDLWFQLYPTRDPGISRHLLAGARAAGFRVLIVTVDTAVGGRHLRDVRNGLTIPPALTLSTLAGMARFPRWWIDKLTTDPVSFALLDDIKGSKPDIARTVFDPDLDDARLSEIRSAWDGPLVVKGILDPEDAARIAGLGVDGIVVSNHGGRQLDRMPPTAHQLPRVRERLGDGTALLVDSGIVSGQDIAAALALGADAVLVGRAYLYGLMAAGGAGVSRVIEILAEEFRRTLQLMGATSAGELIGRVTIPAGFPHA
jgi:L-lactate dehydrogenase (cytochrome)